MHKGIPLFTGIVIFLGFCALYPQQTSPSPAVEDFELQGVALFQCQCAAHACPCQNREMLAQFGDFSGHWTAEQLAIIHKQGLSE